MRKEGLEISDMGETVDSEVGRHQILEGSTDAHEIGKFIDGAIPEYKHEPTQPDQDAARVQREHGLYIPVSPGCIPNVPDRLVHPKKDAQRNTDFFPRLLTCALEAYQAEGDQD